MGKKTVRVLLIEDNPLDVEIIDRALDRYRRLNFEVVSVDSTRAGRKVLSKESVDVVLLDYNLPGDDGLAASVAERGRTPTSRDYANGAGGRGRCEGGDQARCS